ncbi:radial spoke head 10 homolog B [Bombina bombina]|uniref:radial spoke head 10 homolog B n=1 Tax=Bombina bombina TaxID=8345 RepID=UPI00235B1353|nr:radial spoke head 10 homolog B [Bombina bombina]
MAKTKKKDNKKTDKLKVELSEECNSKVSPALVVSVEEQLITCRKPTSCEAAVKKQGLTPKVPTPEVYQEPFFAQLFVVKYEGEMVDGLYDGEGVAYFKDGNVYRGIFSEGRMHGNGKYSWTDDVTYEGDFIMNSITGHGLYTWPNGSQYEGEVYNGLRHGTGQYTSEGQEVLFVGEWLNGKRHGKGTIYYNKERTSWYEGEWNGGQKEGWGIQRFASGNIYEGQWKENKFHGVGRMRWISADEEYTGEWENGIQNGYGSHTWFTKREPKTQFSMRNEYVGSFVSGARHGYGQFNYADGSMYVGEWKNNTKHGMAKFISKSGQVYIGEFHNDQMVEFPNNPALLGSRRNSVNGADNSYVGALSLIDTYIEVDISPLLLMFPQSKWIEEMKQVEYVILRNLMDLRNIYSFYSSLAKENIDNTFLMTKLQFWRFLKDCEMHHYNITLSEIDRILTAGDVGTQEVHCPFETILLRTFISKLICLSYHICQIKSQEDNLSPADCFSKILNENILPNAKKVKGFLFSDLHKAAHAMCYIDKCWEIYRTHRRQSTSTDCETVMQMRHFIWLLNDLNITNKTLTVKNIVDILAADDTSVRDGNEMNLELEMTFLEFFEALLGCAAICVTDETINEFSRNELFPEEQTHEDVASKVSTDVLERVSHCLDQFRSKNLPRGQFMKNAWKFTGKGQNQPVTFYCNKKTDLDINADKWFIQINIFFGKMFFPAHEHAEKIKEEIPKYRLRQAEKARLIRIREEEEARLRSLRAEEEARRLAEKEAEHALALAEAMKAAEVLAEEDQTVQLQIIPKEEPPVTPPQSGTKSTPGAARKKKKAA